MAAKLPTFWDKMVAILMNGKEAGKDGVLAEKNHENSLEDPFKKTE